MDVREETFTLKNIGIVKLATGGLPGETCAKGYRRSDPANTIKKQGREHTLALLFRFEIKRSERQTAFRCVTPTARSS